MSSKAKVFVSCGQKTAEERAAAASLRQMLLDEGFDPYVAIQAQSIQDINNGVLAELRRSDFYIFVDFKRESLASGKFRGSLFSHQELAIAYFLGFENAIFLQQDGVVLEGMLAHILSNATRFADPSEIPALAKQLLQERGWVSSYSRHLWPQKVDWHPKIIPYSDHTGIMTQRVLFGWIQNRRKDLGAIDAQVRLVQIGRLPLKTQEPPDRSELKWAGHPGYSVIIRPGDYEKVGLLALSPERPGCVYLQSALDISPRQAVIQSSPGEHILTYEVFAPGFSILRFSIRLILRDQVEDAEAELLEVEHF